jgi:hypothetical protein
LGNSSEKGHQQKDMLIFVVLMLVSGVVCGRVVVFHISARNALTSLRLVIENVRNTTFHALFSDSLRLNVCKDKNTI